MTALRDQLAIAGSQVDPHIGEKLCRLVLESAEAAGDQSVRAAALIQLADYNQLLGKQREAHAQSSLAAQALRELADTDGEAQALTVLSRASSALGHYESAIEASLLAVKLTETGSDAALRSDTLSQLGLVLAFSKSFDAASQALEQAEAVARSAGRDLDELAAIVRQGSCEAVRVITLRHEEGAMPQLGRIAKLLERMSEFTLSHDMNALAEPDQRPLVVFGDLVGALFRCWLGDHEEATTKLIMVRNWLRATNHAPWMEGFLALTECEVALAQSDWRLAEQAARRMSALTGDAGQQHSATLGHILLAHCLAIQSQHAQALDVLKKLASLERRARTASLETRNEVVLKLLEMRHTENERQEWKASAGRLERLSMEDPLTGISNRRCFEQEARELLHHAQTGLDHGNCLAVLDIDHFKQVNDLHSHIVGDKVLQIIGTLLNEHVRDTDLAARLGGDEFVVLFRNADEQVAREACSRVSKAVQTFDWEAVSPGLSVGVSIGLSQAIAGDSLETLTDRSDKDMYARKRAARQATSGSRESSVARIP